MQERAIQSLVQTAVEHLYAVAYRLGLLHVEADDPLKPGWLFGVYTLRPVAMCP